MDLAWTDFLNSLVRDWRGGGGPAEDHLAQPAWQSAFLAKWGLDAPVPAATADLDAARRLRALLLELAARVLDGGTIPADGIGALNAALAGAPVRRTLEAGGEHAYAVRLGPAATGWTVVLGEVAASFARTLAEMDPARIRLCANPDCRWAFYDDTRNGSKRFCEPSTCGNLMRVRRFRRRRT